MYNLNRNSNSCSIHAASHVSDVVLANSALTLNPDVAATELCRACNNLISGEHYRINGRKVCTPCAIQARTGLSVEGEAAFAGALFFGFMGSTLGLIFCVGFTISTHMPASYIGIAVAWIVSSSMKRGSNGLGGGRFQVSAVLLTCVTIWLAAATTRLLDTYSKPGAAVEWTSETLHRPVSELVGLFFGAGSDLWHLVVRVGCLCAGFCIAWQMTKSRPVSIAGPYGLMAP